MTGEAKTAQNLEWVSLLCHEQNELCFNGRIIRITEVNGISLKTKNVHKYEFNAEL